MSPWGWPELATLFLHFMTLSLMSVGGAITTVPEMHRYLVNQQAWLSESQFSSCIALAQAAPGPNLLFVAVLGWTVGMNAAGGPSAGPWAWWLASVSVFVAMMGILLPSTTLTFFAARWGQQNRDRPTVRAFKLGMAPIVVGLLVSTGWILGSAPGSVQTAPVAYMLTAASAFVVWQGRIHLLWILGTGAIAGALGWV
ncbi:MAG: chromate transporter [Rhodoferax sp.]